VARIPAWLRTEEEALGRLVLNGDLEREEAAELLHDAIFDRDENLNHNVVRDFGRKRMKKWIDSKVNDFYTEDESEEETGGRQGELFSWLPRTLETSPGRFAHINSMTKRDWDAAKRQAEVKEGNASTFAKAIRRAYDQVVPLLTDDFMTTADVAGQIGE
jgi:hypothetical protein